MKRSREADDGKLPQSSASPHNTQFEIIHGLTRANAEAYLTATRAVHARLTAVRGLEKEAEPNAIGSHSSSAHAGGADVATLLRCTTMPWLCSLERALQCVLDVRPTSEVDQTTSATPLLIRTVQLVANDGETLVLAEPEAASPANETGGIDDGGLRSIHVPKSVGENVYAGDVLLVRHAQRGPQGTSPEISAARTTFCTIDAGIFEDEDSWGDAVAANAVAVMRWVGALTAQAPGLPQLTFMQSCATGGEHDEGVDEAVKSGWYRTLQLPLLFQVRKSLRGSLPSATVERLVKVILAALSSMLNVFRYSQSVMNLAAIHRGLLHTFLASPLFTDGFSTVLSQSAEMLGSDAWSRTAECLADALEISVGYSCPSIELSKLASGPDSANDRAAEANALGSLEVVLHRLSASWVDFTRKLREMLKHGQERAPDSLQGQQRVYKMLESLADDQVFQPVTRWLQQREVNVARKNSVGDVHRAGGSAAAVATLLERVQLPPGLLEVRSLNEQDDGSNGGGLGLNVVTTQVSAMKRTYTPYLGQDALRFLEAAAIAAHAELYGPAARAAHRLLETPSEGIARAGCPRVVAVEQPPLREGGFSSYTMAEARHIAEYGLPVHLTLSFSTGSDAKHRGRGAADRFCHALSGLHGGSWFMFLLVRLQDRPALFPVLCTAATVRPGDEASDGAPSSTVAVITAHVMKDADVAAQFLLTSAALDSSGHADAWLFFEQPAVGEHAQQARNSATGTSATRFLPPNTPALAYVDILSRLHAMRDELNDELNNGKTAWSSRSGSSVGAGGSYSISCAPPSSYAMWLRYFAQGVAPTQADLQSLSASANGIVTGTGSAGREVSSSLLREATNGMPFTPAQVEALHALTSGSVAHSASVNSSSASAAGAGGSGGGALSSLRVVEGAVGSGKTAVLYAAATVKGKLLAAARREHQASLNPMLRDAAGRAKKCVAQAEQASTLMDLLPDSSLGAANDGSRVVSASLVDSMTATVEDQLREFSRFSRGAQYCTAPLLMRCGRPSVPGGDSTLPKSVQSLLDLSRQDEESMPFTPSFTSLTALLNDSYARSCNAPLASRLSRQLASLGALGGVLTAVAAQSKDASQIEARFLPLLMSARETEETMTAAAAAEMDWGSYLSAKLWSAVTSSELSGAVGTLNAAAASSQDDGAEGGSSWSLQVPAAEGETTDTFAPVHMPETTHLTRLDSDQAAGWHSVYLQKQGHLTSLLWTHLHESSRHIFRLFLSLVHGVAAVAQVGKYDMVTCSDGELLQSLGLPFLWCWSPSHVFVDDFSVMQDGVLLALSPCNSLTLSYSAEVPVFAERYLYQAPVSILRALRKDLHKTAALTTTVLHESMRCRKPEIMAALGQLCVTGAAFASLLLPSLDAEDEGRNDEDEENDTGATPCFPGFASFSSLEMWTHAVPVYAGATADRVCARYLCKLRRHPSRDTVTADEDAAQCRVSVCFPHAAEARAFRQDLLEDDACATQADVRVRSIPFLTSEAERETTVDSDAEAAAEDECGESDIVIVCLSGLVPPAGPPSSGDGRASAREKQWTRWLQARDTSSPTNARPGESTTEAGDTAEGIVALAANASVIERLQWWLWRVLSQAKEGAVVICSKELVARAPLFQYLEQYVTQLRRQLCPQKHLSYWLPREAGSAVLALVCPDHYRCRQTAFVAGTESGAAPCDVSFMGASHCESLCLKGFHNCESRSHACLHACHVELPPAEDDTHDHCPYPCGKSLPCGHVCDRDCGTACEPCSFVGLRELTCGQRLVCGVDSSANNAVQYEHFHHFQEALCGAAVKPCVELVLARCPRCGTKSPIPCFQLTSHESRVQQALRDEKTQKDAGTANASAAPIPGTGGNDGTASVSDFILADGECPGCVAVFNRVAKKFGFDELPAPNVVQRLQDEKPGPGLRADGVDGTSENDGANDQEAEDGEENLCAMREPATLPRHKLSPEAQTDLRKAFAVSAKKAELLLMKEALEVGNGMATDTSDYVQAKRANEAHRATQQQQERKRQESLRAQMEVWAQRLRAEYVKQSALSSTLEGMMPSLVGHAEEEATRQSNFTF